MPNTNWIEANDIGYNYLKPNGFRLVFHNIPKVSFFCQSSNLPGIIGGRTTQMTPFRDMFVVGDKVEYEDFQITFIIDSEMKNYNELALWMKGIYFPDTRSQFISLRSSGKHDLLSSAVTPYNEESGIYSDATMFILTPKDNPQIQVSFHQMAPITLSGVPFVSTINDIDYMVANATFGYKNFAFEYLDT